MAQYPMSRKHVALLASRGTFAVLLVLVLSVLAGCGQESAQTPPAGLLLTATGQDQAPAPAAAAADPALSRLFSRIAGLPDRNPAEAPWMGESSWKSFAELVGGHWADFDRSVLGPMKTWAEVDLKEAREDTGAVFYPFGGPDFVTSDILYPGVGEAVLMGLEPVGNLPDFDRASAKWRDAFFADLGELVSGFLERGYFITREMNDIYTRGKVDGALPVIAFFMGRAGYDIVEVKRLLPSADGGWAETPYARMTARPHRPFGVRIAYLKPGDAAARNVYYFCCDVENKAFRTETPLYRFFAGLSRVTTFVKSGSYLLHWANFSALRTFILDRSLYVLQDDTAVPYRYFVEKGWDVRLFGRYGKPVKDFTNVEQADLRQAYENPATGVAPLPFHFGYHWKSQIDNLLLAKRPRGDDKTPPIK